MKKAILPVNIAVLLFGLAGLFARWISLPASGITFGRVLFSSVTLGLYMLIRRMPFKVRSRAELLKLILAGAVLALHWWAFMESVRRSGVAIGTITFSSFPLFVTFLEPALSHKKPRAADVLTALAVLAGVVITIPAFTLEDRYFQGIVIGMISSLAYAVLTLMNKSLVSSCGGTKTAFYEQAAAAILLLPVVLGAELSPSAADIGLLLLLGVVTTALAHTLFITGLRHLSAQLAGIISSMETVYAIFFTWILLGQAPTAREACGAAVIIGAVVLSCCLGQSGQKALQKAGHDKSRST